MGRRRTRVDQAKWFGWVNPSETMVAYDAHRAVLDPNFDLYALAATTDPGGSSVLPARRAGVPHYQDCDSTQSPLPPDEPTPNLDNTRLHRLAVDPAAYTGLRDAALENQRKAWDATAAAVAIAMAGAEPLFIEVASVIREVFGALAAGTPISDSQWAALDSVQRVRKSLWMRPGYIEMQPSTADAVTSLYRAHHNIDRAVEALALWRPETPDYADIIYAAQQVSKEAQLWPTATSSRRRRNPRRGRGDRRNSATSRRPGPVPGASGETPIDVALAAVAKTQQAQADAWAAAVSATIPEQEAKSIHAVQMLETTEHENADEIARVYPESGGEGARQI